MTAPPPCSCSDEKGRVDTITYSFPSFDGAALALFGSASTTSRGAIQLTPDIANSPSTFMVNQTGSTLLPTPVKLWHVDSHGVRHDASFTMILYRVAEELAVKGEGLAFVIAPDLNGPPPGSHGGFLGLTNTTARAASPSGSSFVAVEFDTVRQPYDPDDNHIGLNIGSIESDVVAAGLSSLPPPYRNITLAPQASPLLYTVWIDYSGVGNHIWVYIAVEGQPKPTRPHLEAPLNLSNHVPQQAFVGFSASTGVGYELHCIASWNLTVDKLPDDRNKQWKQVVLPAVLGSAAVTAVMIAAAGFYFNSKYKELKMELVLSEALRRLPGTPREFKYAVVRKATNNFHQTRKLGQGGFGAVYRGTLRPRNNKRDGRSTVEVAVKRFTTRNDSRGYDDFLAEVDIINRLRHRNIVPLVGWCYQKGELLLIYEYMPNGSLDQHLFHKEEDKAHRTLGWSTRYDIVADVAAGLHYVHHEHEQMVLHRDIKASNVMLDAGFRGRLGDFGLARVVDKNSYTDLGVAATWGFIAPEYSVCHKATRKTDVYAFGVLVLEVVTGRRALGGEQRHDGSSTSFQLLTDWVWSLHREGRLLDAVDGEVVASVEEEFDADADAAARLLLVGLACSNPNPSDRPSMADVVRVVAGSASPPDVPLVKPTFVWPPEGGVPLELDDEMAAMSDDVDWEETSSSEALPVSAPSQINRPKASSVVQSRKCRSADECRV